MLFFTVQNSSGTSALARYVLGGGNTADIVYTVSPGVWALNYPSGAMSQSGLFLVEGQLLDWVPSAQSCTGLFPTVSDGCSPAAYTTITTGEKLISMAWSSLQSPTAAGYGPSSSNGNIYFIVQSSSTGNSQVLYTNSAAATVVYSTYQPPLGSGQPAAVAADAQSGNIYFTVNTNTALQLWALSSSPTSFSSEMVVDVTSLLPGGASNYNMGGVVINWSGTTAYMLFLTKTMPYYGGIIAYPNLPNTGGTASAIYNPPRYTNFQSPFDSLFMPAGLAMVPKSSGPDVLAVVDMTPGEQAIWTGTPLYQQ
jgi:hypothetical protein